MRVATLILLLAPVLCACAPALYADPARHRPVSEVVWPNGGVAQFDASGNRVWTAQAPYSPATYSLSPD